MGKTRTYEQSLLNNAEIILTNNADDYEARLQIIEACAALYGKYSIDEYWNAFGIEVSCKEKILNDAAILYEEIEKTGIPGSLAISSLSTKPIPDASKKTSGAFYTDFRLAEFTSEDCLPYLTRESKVADIASGTGILLSAIAEKYYSLYPDLFDDWISSCLFAFDLSEYALRGARAAVSVHTASIPSLKKMFSNWKACDSLFDDAIKENYYDIVCGNPPWTKVKLSRHLFLNQNGENHTYGTEYTEFDDAKYLEERADSLNYSKAIKMKYSLLGNAEPDMYMAFIQKSESALKPGGHLSYIVPAGLIRSQGTETIRRFLIDNGSSLSFYLFDNKARFFGIDTRFKFLLMSYTKEKEKKKNTHCEAINMSICCSENKQIKKGETVEYNIKEIESIRPDLTIPECKNNKEKSLFLKIYNNGCAWKDKWNANPAREIDMTNNRNLFQKNERDNSVPLIEGRMVQNFRFGTKSYISGAGRSAKWAPSADKGNSQYYIPLCALSDSSKQRISQKRVGYCDIAGQTNERAMMSCIIPSGVICGNKVPTICFERQNAEDLMYFWTGVTNSFVFDWMLRRILSTTVNYFLLFSLPMPDIDLASETAQKIISKTKYITDMGSEYYTSPVMPELRAEIDLCVSTVYGLSFADLELIMKDFPLLDRAQPALNNESKSTITRDLFLSKAEKHYGEKKLHYTARYKKAIEAGAKAYIPTEMTILYQD